MKAMHTATGLPFPLFSLSFQASWPISSKFFVLYSSKLVLYMIEGGNNFSTKGTWRAVFCTYLLAALFIMPESREVVGKLTYRRGNNMLSFAALLCFT